MAGKRFDLSGQKFGRLTAMEIVSAIPYQDTLWRCVCECGGEKVVSIHSLRRDGGVKSCGCWSREARVQIARNMIAGNIARAETRDLTGQRFGRLVCISKYGRKNNRRGIYWNCKCDCGKLKSVTALELLAGNTNSCGCYRRELKLGTNNMFWKHGDGSRWYPPEFNDSLKFSIKSRDMFLCQSPNRDRECEGYLCIHHIDGDKMNNNPYNLVSLCNRHHKIVELDAHGWEFYFGILVGDYTH